MAHRGKWWRRRHLLERFVGDLVAGEFALLRRHAAPLLRQPWPPTLAIDRDLGADSLEVLQLATALAEAIHLHRSGIEDYLLARRTLGQWVDLAAAGLEQFSGELTFRTSGSSDLPKPCVHPLASLLQETVELANLFAGRRRILVAVPSHHIYGFLFSVLLPDLLDLDDDAIIDLCASSPASLAGLLRDGDMVVAHPDFWQAVVRGAGALPPGVIGVSSTAPCADTVSEALAAAGLQALFQVYGSSETAGIGWRASHQDAYRLFPFWQRAVDSESVLTRSMPDGSLQHLESQDTIAWEGAETFRLGARVDAAVQVGGVNVFPLRVAALLAAHPLVAEAAVRLMRADEGNRLKAFVVPAPHVSNTAQLARVLEAWAEQTLAVPERPRAFSFGASLPRGAAGKQCDWLIDG
ncbi:AMP-binding enzyme [Massilia sp. TWR1-2-2]|uniref:AMP-binding enzyme n=1 Tax=Massilia sp. TWR1-2-2 TaxID=2804584 RepID=UPI003CEFB18F